MPALQAKTHQYAVNAAIRTPAWPAAPTLVADAGDSAGNESV